MNIGGLALSIILIMIALFVLFKLGSLILFVIILLFAIIGLYYTSVK